MRTLVFAFLFFVSIFGLLHAQTTPQTKALCYSGSTLYQQITQDCTSKDKSYTGVWYCSTIKVCEANISPYRECMVTRGCATEAECTTSTGIYSNSKVTINNQTVAGMTMTATCCLANNFAEDDTIAIDYTQICNSATTSRAQTVGALAVVLAVSAYFIRN